MTPAEEHADLLERIIVIGATTAVTIADVSATDAARTKLLQAADAMMAAQKLNLDRQQLQSKTDSDRIDTALKAFRTQMADSST
jgi:hypothetical protein